MFVFTEPELQPVTFDAGESTFTVLIQPPSFDQLLDIYQQHSQVIQSTVDQRSSRLPAELAKALRDLFVGVARSWQDVTDDNGVKMPFSRERLGQILDRHPRLYMQAISAINAILRTEREREKNVTTSSDSVESSVNTPVK